MVSRVSQLQNSLRVLTTIGQRKIRQSVANRFTDCGTRDRVFECAPLHAGHCSIHRTRRPTNRSRFLPAVLDLCSFRLPLAKVFFLRLRNEREIARERLRSRPLVLYSCLRFGINYIVSIWFSQLEQRALDLIAIQLIHLIRKQ